MFKLKTGQIVKDFDRFFEPYVYRGLKVIGSSLSYIQSRGSLRVVPDLVFADVDNQNLLLKINIPLNDKIYDHQVVKEKGVVMVGTEGGYIYAYSLTTGEIFSSVWLKCKRLWGFDLLFRGYDGANLTSETRSLSSMVKKREFSTPTQVSNINFFSVKGKRRAESEVDITIPGSNKLRNKAAFSIMDDFLDKIYGVVSIQNESNNTVIHTFMIDEENKLVILSKWEKKLEIQFSEIKLGIVVKGYPIIVAAGEKGPSKIYMFVFEPNGVIHELKEEIFNQKFRANYGFLFSSIVRSRTGTLITGGNSESIVCLRFFVEGSQDIFSEDEDSLDGLGSFVTDFDIGDARNRIMFEGRDMADDMERYLI